MKFVDEVQIHVKAGDGGDGAVAWRREKFIPRGGPAGGDGGDGGSVLLVADPQLATLLDYRFVHDHRAKNGEAGRGNDQNGRGGPDLELRVPPGTVVRDAGTGEVLCDLSAPGQRIVIAKGGRGGLGNMNFATSTNQAPRHAEEGTEGEEKHLVLELKLLADVGIVGFPNAGKSTLISRISHAKPKIADYPFTTLVPNLGVVDWRGERSFVVADIPGLVEGAHEGAGLGHRFLRHVERCRVLVHLVDGAPQGESRAARLDHDAIRDELARYSPLLAGKPQVVAVSKADLPDAKTRAADLRRALSRRARAAGLPAPEVLLVSAVTGEGLSALLDRLAGVLYDAPSRDRGGAGRKLGKRREGR